MAKWAKGQSGNPGGRPKVLAEVRDLARRYAPVAIAELGRLAVKAKSETARVAAIKELLDRGYGRAGEVADDVGEIEHLRHEIVVTFVDPADRHLNGGSEKAVANDARHDERA